MSSTCSELRQKHYNDFIQIYYKNLTEIIRHCGSNPGQLFTFSDLQNQLKKFGFYGVAVAPILLEIMTATPNSFIDLDSLAEDQNSSELSLATYDELSTTIYRQKLMEALVDAEKYEWILR